jgi:hypothetical protein
LTNYANAYNIMQAGMRPAEKKEMQRCQNIKTQ